MKPGQIGFKWSEKIKAKIRASCLNRKFTEEQKEKRVQASIDIWGKPVINLTTGEEFKTESHAARHYRLKPSQISRVCLGQRNTVHKMIFKFKE